MSLLPLLLVLVLAAAGLAYVWAPLSRLGAGRDTTPAPAETRAPRWARRLLRAIGDVEEDLALSKISPDDAAAEIRRIESELAVILRESE